MPLAEIDAHSPARRRVLIVDDDEAVLGTLTDYFEMLGLFSVETARNGYEAGWKTVSFRPHLLMLDYNLGDITGEEVAKRVRNDPALKNTKILVMSGFLTDEHAGRLLDQGVDEFLRKPFSLEGARDKIFRLLRLT